MPSALSLLPILVLVLAATIGAAGLRHSAVAVAGPLPATVSPGVKVTDPTYVAPALLMIGHGVRSAGVIVMAAMVWFAVAKISLDSSSIVNLNGVKRELAFFAAGLVMAAYGAGSRFTFADVMDRMRQSFALVKDRHGTGLVGKWPIPSSHPTRSAPSTEPAARITASLLPRLSLNFWHAVKTRLAPGGGQPKSVARPPDARCSASVICPGPVPSG